MSDKVPEWAIKEAKGCICAKEMVESDLSQARIARALLSAYRRGVEDSARVAERHGAGGIEYDLEPEACVATSVASQTITAAIRRLGEAE